MPVIDVQVHAYERNHPGRPWVGQLHGPQSATGEEMVAAMDAVGVDGAVLVSVFTMYRYDASYVLEVEAKHADRFCLARIIHRGWAELGEAVLRSVVIGGVGDAGNRGLRLRRGVGPGASRPVVYGGSLAIRPARLAKPVW